MERISLCRCKWLGFSFLGLLREQGAESNGKMLVLSEQCQCVLPVSPAFLCCVPGGESRTEEGARSAQAAGLALQPAAAKLCFAFRL